MKVEELVVLGGEDLADALKNARRELFELHFKLAVGQLDNHREILKARKDIARIMTVIRQRELGIGPSQPEDELGAAEVEAEEAPEATGEETEGAQAAEAAEEPEAELEAAAEPQPAVELTPKPEPEAEEKAPRKSRRRQPAKEDE
jgi:large subunit ribosomal protein L29